MHGICQRLDIADGYEDAGLAVGEDLARPRGAVAGDDLLAQHQGFDEHRGQALELGAVHHQLCVLHPWVGILREAQQMYVFREAALVDEALQRLSVLAFS